MRERQIVNNAPREPDKESVTTVYGQAGATGQTTCSRNKKRPPSKPTGTTLKLVPAPCQPHCHKSKGTAKASTGSMDDNRVARTANHNEHTKERAPGTAEEASAHTMHADHVNQKSIEESKLL